MKELELVSPVEATTVYLLPIYLAGNYLPIYLAGPINVKIYMITNIKKSKCLILSNLKIQFIVDFNIVLKI